MTKPQDQTLLPFDLDVAQILRRAGQIAGAGPVDCRHIRQAFAQSACAPLPPTTLYPDPLVRGILDRARRLAFEARLDRVPRAALAEALREDQARSLGLDLARLRFVRYRLSKLYDGEPRLRCH